jgi:nucleoside-diphosphate-sugar epimerase
MMRRRLSYREAFPRIIADFLIVHSSMIGALAISVAYQLAWGTDEQAQQLVTDFARYYVRFFWVMSPIFPLTFALLGFYTHTRFYEERRKNLAIVRGVAVAVILFFGVNWLVGNTTVGRSVAFPFVALASFGLCFSRFFKNYLDLRFEIKRRNEFSTPNRDNLVLVVGGAGYIGSLLCEKLIQHGYKVRVLDALLYGREPLRAVENHPNFELIMGDCRNMQDVVRAVQGVSAIVDLAAIVGDPACEQDRAAALEINYGATRMMIEVAKGNGVERFVFASSCSVYGATDEEVDEQAKVSPISVYAQTKVDSERALLAAAGPQFHPSILRLATVFGLGYRPRFDLVVNLLSARAKQDGKITVFNGQQWRPFIHVRDVVEAMILVLEAPVRFVAGEIFNVGDSRLNYTLQQVAETIREVFPDTSVENVANSDLRNYRVNFNKIRSRLNFQAHYTMRNGVDELRAAFDGRLIIDYKDLRYHNQRFLEVAGVVRNKTDVDSLLMDAFARVV